MTLGNNLDQLASLEVQQEADGIPPPQEVYDFHLAGTQVALAQVVEGLSDVVPLVGVSCQHLIGRRGSCSGMMLLATALDNRHTALARLQRQEGAQAAAREHHKAAALVDTALEGARLGPLKHSSCADMLRELVQKPVLATKPE
jgi:hypothetical protein